MQHATENVKKKRKCH